MAIPKTIYTYELDGSRVDFPISFEYLARKFIVVTLVGATRRELVRNTEYRFSSKNQITTFAAWGESQGFRTIEIRRNTSATDRLVDFLDGSILRAADLNIANIQALHIADEARDLAADTIAANEDGNLDARGRRIANVGFAVDQGDAVPLGQVKQWDASALNSSTRAKDAQTRSEQASLASETWARESERFAMEAQNLPRTMRVSMDEPSLDLMPPISERAGKILGFDDTGAPTAYLPPSGSGTELALLLKSLKGAGEVGYDLDEAYVEKTIGAAIRSMAMNVESLSGEVTQLKKRAVFIDPVGTGVDAGPRINAASRDAGPHGDLFFSVGSYGFREDLIQYHEGQIWHGSGGQRGTTFVQLGNVVNSISVGSLGGLMDINVECKGDQFNGNGISATGYSMVIERVRCVGSKGPSLRFPGPAGGTNVRNFEGSTSAPMDVPAIDYCKVSTVRPIFMNGIWLSGGYVDVSNSGNGCSFSNFYMSGIETGTGHGLMHFANGRVGNASKVCTITGGQTEFTNVAFAGDVSLVAATGMMFSGCSFKSVSEDDVSNSNHFTAKGRMQGWGQTSGVGPSIGDGILQMDWVRNGNVTVCSLLLRPGSTTTFGDGAGAWTFPLPYTGTPDINADGLIGLAFSTAQGKDFYIVGQIAKNTRTITFGSNGAGVRNGTPFAWREGDKLALTFTYINR